MVKTNELIIKELRHELEKQKEQTKKERDEVDRLG
ncbi:hypothetical protein LCGC14_1776170, partial [marine sediment metagenome]